MKTGRLNWMPFAKIARKAMYLLALAVFGAQAAPVATVGDAEYGTLDEAIKAVQDGGTIVVNAGEYKLNGSLAYTGKAFTIQAAEGAKVTFDMSAAVTLHGAKITFTGVTFDYKTNVDYIGLQHADTLVYNDCAINGKVFLYAASETFSKCVFEQKTEDYNVWTYGAKSVTFSGCTFKSVGKTINAYIEAHNASAEPQKIKLEDCKVESSKSNKAVLNIKNKTQAYEVVLSGKNEVSGIDANGTTKSAWYQVETTDSTETACKAVTVTETADDGTSKVVYEAKPYAAEKAVDFATFVAALEEANYTFDGSKHTLAQDGKLTVKWSPKSGCYDTREGHNCTVENVLATANTPKRVNSGLTQFQLFEGKTFAVSVKNVAFVYEPADFTVCENSNWKGAFTVDDAPAGQIYLMNAGDVTFEDCTFDKVVLTSFNCTGTSTVKGCSFKNVYNSYAVKDIRGAKVSVTGCAFEDCGAAVMVSATDKVEEVTISGNTFKNVDVAGTAAEGKVGTRGLIQIASSGDYSETAFDFSDNTATDCGPVMRQLNKTVSFDTTDKTALDALVSENGCTSLYTSDTFDPRTLGYATSDTAEALPAAPDMSGEVVNVTAAQAQYVLDGAYGPIVGKTINFTESIDATLVLGRASKYDGSQTVYRHGSHAGEAMGYADFIAYKSQSGWTENCYYERTVENVTFTAEEGVTVRGFTAEGGAHVYGTAESPVYDYVRDTGVWCKDTNASFYKRAILKNITFKGLDFTAKVDLSTSEATTVYDGFTFTGCTFEIGNTTSEQAIRYYNENANDNVKNLVVETCTFRNCFQGVYTANAKNVTVKDSTFDTTGHNAIAVQDAVAFDHGEVVITDNTFKNVGDRIIRFGHVGDGTTITISGNTADGNSGKLDKATGKREIVKAETLPENAADSVKASNNNWGANTVVAGVFIDDYATKLGTEACPYSREQFAAMTRADYIAAQKHLNGTLYVNVGDYAYDTHGVLGNGVRNDAVGQTPDHSKLNAYGENGYLGEQNDGANGHAVVFVGGTITSGVKGYASIDNIGTSLLLAVPAYTKVTFTNTVFKNVLSFDYQLYTSPWSQLGGLTFNGCTFDGIIVGALASQELAFTGCAFKNYVNETSAKNSNPTWIRPAYGNWSKGDNEGQGEGFRSLTKITFEDNTVTSTRPVKFERIAQWEMATTVTATGNTFDITPQEGDTSTKNVGLYFGANAKFDLVVDDNKKTDETAALYTAVYSASNGGNYAGLPAGSTVKNKAGEDVTIEDALAWKTTDALTLRTTEEVASVTNAKDVSVNFATLAEAIAAAADGETVKLLMDTNGDGIAIAANTFKTGLTVDFGGHTYTVGGLLVGSSGTASNGFQLNAGNKITFKNGAIVGATATAGTGTDWTGAPAILIQNYCDLTLEKMTVKGGDETCYTLSNNNGEIVIADSTIVAGQAKGTAYSPVAFDVCRYASYPSVHVTVKGSSVIEGDVEVSGTVADGQSRQLDIEDGTFKGAFKVADEPANIAISGGTFSTAIDAAYCASGFIPTKNADGTYGVKKGAYVAQVGTTKYDTLEGAIEAAVAAGQAVELLDDVVVTDFTLNVGVTIRSADGTRREIKGLKAITGTGVTLENVYLNLDQTLDIGGTDTTLKNCVMRAKDVGYSDIADGVTTGFTGGKKWTDNAGSYLVRITGTNVALTDCLFDGTDKDEGYFPNMCLAPVSGTNVTMTRCTFNEGWAACYYSTPHGTWTLDDCKFTKIYCYNIQAGDTAANIVVKNCELAGWTSFGSDMASVSFEKCSFAKSSGYATIVAYKDVTFTDCSFTEDYKGKLCIEADTVADLTGCTVVDADGNASTTVSLADLVELDADTGFAAIDATKNEDGKYTAGRFVGKEDAIRSSIAEGYALTVGDDGSYTLDTAVAQIGTKDYASLAEAISAAKSGDTITLLADVVNTDYAVANAIDIKLASGVTLDGNGKTISGNVKVTVSSEGGVTIKNANFRDIHNAADVSDAYKTKYGFSDDKVGTLSAIYAPNLAGALTISGCTFENSDWEAMQITPAEGAKIDIRNNVFKTSESDVVKEQLRHVHIEMAYGTDFDYEGTDIELTITDNQFLGETKEANMGVWWVGKTSTLDVTGNYYANPDAVSITLSDKSFKRENRCDLIYPARSVADVDVDDLTAVALVVKDEFNATAHQTFEAAVAAADAGATVKMLADVTLTEKQTIAKAVVLDLNGKTISSTVDEFITIAQNGDLTVNDATGEGRIENTATSGSAIRIETGTVGGILTLTGGSILAHSSNDAAVYSQSCGGEKVTVNIKGGRIENDGTNSYAVKLGSNTGTINVTGGEIVGGQHGLYVFVYNVVNISGGTILAKTGNAVYSGANNKITISGGTLTPGGTAAALAIGGGSTATSSCTVTVGREGGTVDDVTIPSIDFKPGYSANMATVNLLSGIVQKFLNFDEMTVEKVSQGKDKLLVGTDISKCLLGSDLLCQLDAASGLYEIVALTVENAAAIVTHNGEETPYHTVEQACKAVADGDTLTLKVDHTGALVLSAKNVTVDLGGKTLTYTGATGGLSSALSFNQSTASDNTVTVKNGTIVAKAQDATCVRAEMTGDLSKTLTVVFGKNLTLTSGNTGRYGGVVLGTGARTASPCEKMTKGGLLVTEGETQWIYGETETAFTHANGTEVTLLNDWYCTDYNGAIKVPDTSAFGSAKLNLDGHTIEHHGAGAAIVMGNDAKPSEGTAAKTLEVSNGTIKTSQYGAAVCGSNKSLTLDGVTLTTTGDKMFGLYANGMTRGNTVTLKNRSAVVSEKATGIYFPGAGTLTVENSNVTGGMSGIEVRAGVLNVSGTSVVESTAEEFNFKNDDNGITTTGAAVAAVKHTVGNDLAVMISGGTFKGPRGFYANDPNADKEGTVTVAISGGAFSTDVEKDYLADGCKTVQQTIDGVLYYVVGPAVTQIEVSLGDVKKRLPFADAWLADKIGTDASGWTTAALEAKAANELATWQCYLFGLDPNDATAKIVATAGQGTVESIPLTVANADASASPLVKDGLVTVTYVLMGSDDNATWAAQVAEAATPDGLAIPLTGTVYRFYRVDVKVTSAESAEGN